MTTKPDIQFPALRSEWADSNGQRFRLVVTNSPEHAAAGATFDACYVLDRLGEDSLGAPAWQPIVDPQVVCSVLARRHAQLDAELERSNEELGEIRGKVARSAGKKP